MSELVEFSRNYAVRLSESDFERLLDCDDDFVLNMISSIEKLGARKINFNGHFGPFIYFTAKKENSVMIYDSILNIFKSFIFD